MRSSRDQWILVAMAAAVTVVLYIWTYGRGLQVGVNRLRQQIRDAEVTRPSRETVAVAQATLLRLRKEVAARTPSSAPAVQFVPPATGLQTVTQILARNQILVVAALAAEKSAGSLLPGDLSKRITERRNGVAPVLWSVQLIGSYEQVRKALEEIASSNLCVIPQDIALDPLAPEAQVKLWTLRIWL